jgi:hypothetical protein
LMYNVVPFLGPMTLYLEPIMFFNQIVTYCAKLRLWEVILMGLHVPLCV